MARTAKEITVAEIRRLTPKDKKYKVNTGGGLNLYVYVFPLGKKSFVWEYTAPDGKRKNYTIGPFPLVSLAQAREKVKELKSQLLLHGIDPAAEKRKTADLVIAIDNYHGNVIIQRALWFALRTAARPGEVTKARWAEINWEDATWRYYVEKKQDQLHIVPPTIPPGKNKEESRRNIPKGRIFIFKASLYAMVG